MYSLRPTDARKLHTSTHTLRVAKTTQEKMEADATRFLQVLMIEANLRRGNRKTLMLRDIQEALDEAQ
jgi:histone H3/H4